MSKFNLAMLTRFMLLNQRNVGVFLSIME